MREGGIPGCDGAAAEAGRPEDAGAMPERGGPGERRMDCQDRGREIAKGDRRVPVAAPDPGATAARVRELLERAKRFDADGDHRGAYRIRRAAGVIALDAGLSLDAGGNWSMPHRVMPPGEAKPADAAGRAAGGDSPALVPSGGSR